MFALYWTKRWEDASFCITKGEGGEELMQMQIGFSWSCKKTELLFDVLSFLYPVRGKIILRAWSRVEGSELEGWGPWQRNEK